jgi:acetyl-CoA carboxylase biotin carboxyl carrier protein
MVTKKNKTKLKSTKILDLSQEGIKGFIDFAKQFKVYSVSVKQKDKKITVYQNPALSVKDASSITENKEIQSADIQQNIGKLSDESIKSKYVGVLHLAPGVVPGKEIKQGELLAKIYSMKIEHQLVAEKSCVIEKVLVAENGPVDYGKPLFIIK